MLKGLSLPKDETQHWKQLYPWFLFPAVGLLIIALFPFSLKRGLAKSNKTVKHGSLFNSDWRVYCRNNTSTLHKTRIR